MEIIISKKAIKLISTLTKNEISVYEYALDLLKQDIDHINKCENEKQFHEDISRFNTAISTQMKLMFRAKYFCQCVGLYLTDNWENNTIEVKTLEG